MKVILLTDIPKVGKRHDVKEFKTGYAQNVLLSKGLAELATPQALAKLEAKVLQANKKKEEEMKAFEMLISSIGDKTVKIKAIANEKGHLFKAVSLNEVVHAIKESLGVDIDEDTLVMDHIKEIGVHMITIKKGNRVGKCNILVEAEK